METGMETGMETEEKEFTDHLNKFWDEAIASQGVDHICKLSKSDYDRCCIALGSRLLERYGRSPHMWPDWVFDKYRNLVFKALEDLEEGVTDTSSTVTCEDS